MNNNVNANFNKYPKIGNWIKKTDNNKLLILSGKVEIGQGILFSLKQLVSDCLQISFDEIEISNASTDSHPNEAVTSGSLSIQDSGLTLKIVCANLLYFAKKKYLSKANLDDKEVKYLSGLFSQDNLNLTRLIDLIDDELLERTIDTTIKQLKSKTKSDENKNSDLLKKLSQEVDRVTTGIIDPTILLNARLILIVLMLGVAFYFYSFNLKKNN